MVNDDRRMSGVGRRIADGKLKIGGCSMRTSMTMKDSKKRKAGAKRESPPRRFSFAKAWPPQTFPRPSVLAVPRLEGLLLTQRDSQATGAEDGLWEV